MKMEFYLNHFFASLLIFVSGVQAQSEIPAFDHLFSPVRQYTVYKNFTSIEIDGKANEPSWESAEWTEDFVDIEGDKKPAPAYQTRMKMLWDERYLYFYAEMEEPHIWAYYTEHDKIVYHENDFEIFIDPDSDTHNYFEFEINAQNTLFDLFMTKPYRNGGIPLISWNSTGIKHAVSIEGTLNNPTDTDKRWSLEVAIPFKDLRTGIHTRIPENGQIWRINFSRVQWQTEITDGKYHRKKDENGRLMQEDNWVWSPIGLVNMHYPERWGLLQFSEMPANAQKVQFQTPETADLRKHLWRIYYKQFSYRQKNGHYAMSFEQLSEANSVITFTGTTLEMELHATEYQFTIIAKTDNGLTLTLNNNGLFRIHKKKQL